MFQFLQKSQKLMMPTVETALPGRPDPIPTAERHFVSNRRLAGPYPDGLSVISLGMGCFWGAERCLWQIPGVYVTMVGYQGGLTPNPTYEETITGLTGHAEVVRVVFNPAQLTLADLLRVFFEAHDPTQGMRQGNDVGTTYRSVIFADSDDDLNVAVAMKNRFQKALDGAGHGGSITTEIAGSGPFYFAEAYHQQYLAKNPSGYCGLRGTGISCPLPAQG